MSSWRRNSSWSLISARTRTNCGKAPGELLERLGQRAAPGVAREVAIGRAAERRVVVGAHQAAFEAVGEDAGHEERGVGDPPQLAGALVGGQVHRLQEVDAERRVEEIAAIRPGEALEQPDEVELGGLRRLDPLRSHRRAHQLVEQGD